jgi:hypothetical protein
MARIIAAAKRAMTLALSPRLKGSTDSVTDSDMAGSAKEDVGSIPLLPEVERGSNEFFRPGWRPQAAM